MIFSSRRIPADMWADLGGKAKGLLWLQSQNIDVPEFYVIPASEIKAFSKERLAEALGQLPEGAYAVRSSALQEDSENHSFAGIFKSFLNAGSKSNLLHSIIEVIESSRSEVVESYLRSRGLEKTSIDMAVVIQKMVQPKISGVGFGVDLHTGDRNSSWISVTEGLGEKLVSGEVQGTEFVFKNEKLEIKSSILNEAINLDVVKEVGRKTLAVSGHAGMPMDVEWAFDGEKIWYVQARPITISVSDRNSDDKTIFDNSNIQESYCGVTTPLTFTYASRAYSQVYAQLMKVMQLGADEIKNASWNLDNMLSLVAGRVYYNINNWYAGLLYLPSFGKRKKEMEDMMGLEKPVSFVTDTRLSTWQKIKRLPGMLKLIAYLVYYFKKMDKLVQDFDRWFLDTYNEADINSVHTLTEFQIFNKIRVYQDRFLEKWAVPVLNDTKVMMDMGATKRILEKYQFQGELKSVIYGAEVESVKPTLEIHRLSKTIGKNTSLVKLFSLYTGHELLKVISIWYPDVAAELKSFIHHYGDRCMGELKLETVTMRQDPEVLFVILRSYIQNGLHLKESLFSSHDRKSEEMFSEVMAKMGRFERFRFRKSVQQLKKSIAAREKMRLHRTRNFGLMRVLYLELGKRWQQRGFISDARDIFYLTHSEIFEIGTGRAVTYSLKSLIELRKNDFNSFRGLKIPTQVELSFPAGERSQNISASQERAYHKTSMDVYSGLACSQGVVEGEILFVARPDQVADITGKILFAERTDPGWTPLFAMIKGVIVEKGSMLSHSAVIAREMGIPAVLNISQATQIFKNGDRVRLDGNTGKVELLERRSSRGDSQELQSSPL